MICHQEIERSICTQNTKNNTSQINIQDNYQIFFHKNLHICLDKATNYEIAYTSRRKADLIFSISMCFKVDGIDP